MPRKELSVEPRQILGKKVAQLRRTGMLPANIYGHGIDSVSVQVASDELLRTLRASAANEVIDIKVAGENIARPVVVHRVQRHPLTSNPLHAEFYQVSLREKMRASVPLVIVGRSEAVETYNGVLVSTMETVQIEALPLDLPAQIEVDISGLNQLEDAIHVRDLPVPANVTVLNDPEVMILKIASPSVAAEGEEAAAGAAAPEAGAPGAAAGPAEETPAAAAEAS